MGETRVAIRAAKKRAFLEAFAQVGIVALACKASGVPRRTHYAWMKDDPAYAEAFLEAEAQAVDVLEAEARRRAVVGVDEPVYYQGERVGEVRKYSDVLLIFLMKGARPERYRDNYRVEHTGADGGPIAHEVRVAEVLERLDALEQGTVIDTTATEGE